MTPEQIMVSFRCFAWRCGILMHEHVLLFRNEKAPEDEKIQVRVTWQPQGIDWIGMWDEEIHIIGLNSRIECCRRNLENLAVDRLLTRKDK